MKDTRLEGEILLSFLHIFCANVNMCKFRNLTNECTVLVMYRATVCFVLFVHIKVA